MARLGSRDRGLYTHVGTDRGSTIFSVSWGKLMDKDLAAYVLNARHDLAVARSTVVDHLTGPNDVYAKVAILQDLDAVDEGLRRIARGTE